MPGQLLGLIFPHQKRKALKSLVFKVQPETCWPQSFRFLSVGTLKTRSLFSCNLKLKDTLLMHFYAY
jgi:hypothetical protein